MQPTKSPVQETKTKNSPAPGAFGAWGFIGGAVLGTLIGLYFDHWVASALLGAAAGWIIGGLIDRSRL
jgi:uncharacterized membrane protein